MNMRNFTRFDYAGGASIRYGEHVIFGHIQNVSLCGLYISTNQEIPSNVPVNVTVYSPKSSIKLNAQVVRSESNGVGLRVNKIDTPSFTNLRNIVAEKCNDQNLIMRETYKMLNCIQ